MSAFTARRCRSALGPLALMAAALAAPLLLDAGSVSAFSSAAGLNRKQAKSVLHTRGNLPKQVLEVPLEEEQAEEAPEEPLLERRLPYTVHMSTQFPHAKQLSEEDAPMMGSRQEGSARDFLQKKLIGALDHVEDMVRNVELILKVEEHFHKEKDGHKKVVVPEVQAVEMSDGAIVEDVRSDFGSTGAKVLAPYQIKVVVSLKNGREVIYSNPEKHAESTLTEAADGMADGLRRLLRDEKDKEIYARRHAKASREAELDTFEEEAIDTIGAAEDAEAEALYERIEATQG